jgi:hypothetical protein
MMDGMMGMMHGWMWLVVLLLVAILIGVVVLVAQSGRTPRLEPERRHTPPRTIDELNRKIDDLLAGAGFQLRELDRGYAEGPKLFVYLYRGVAQPAALVPARTST